MRKFDAIVIGGSAGSFQIIVSILSSLPKTFQIPIILCFHRLRNERHGFVEALLPHSVLPIIEPLDKTVIENGNIYLAPANYHLYIEDNKTGYLFNLKKTKRINFSNLRTIQDNCYEFMKKGYESWIENRVKIINFIKNDP